MAIAAGDADEIHRRRAVVRRRRKKDGVGRKISKLRHEGKSRKQAVATALNMKREGRLGSRGGYRRKR